MQWTWKCTRKLVASSLGGAVCAFGEMADHMSTLRAFHAHFPGLPPGTAGLADCESLFAHLKNKKISTQKFLVRHFLAA